MNVRVLSEHSWLFMIYRAQELLSTPVQDLVTGFKVYPCSYLFQASR